MGGVCVSVSSALRPCCLLDRVLVSAVREDDPSREFLPCQARRARGWVLLGAACRRASQEIFSVPFAILHRNRGARPVSENWEFSREGRPSPLTWRLSSRGSAGTRGRHLPVPSRQRGHGSKSLRRCIACSGGSPRALRGLEISQGSAAPQRHGGFVISASQAGGPRAVAGDRGSSAGTA